MTSWRAESIPEREPKPGEKCVCGKPAVTVFLVPGGEHRGKRTEGYEVPWCGEEA